MYLSFIIIMEPWSLRFLATIKIFFFLKKLTKPNPIWCIIHMMSNNLSSPFQRNYCTNKNPKALKWFKVIRLVNFSNIWYDGLNENPSILLIALIIWLFLFNFLELDVWLSLLNAIIEINFCMVAIWLFRA